MKKFLIVVMFCFSFWACQQEKTIAVKKVIPERRQPKTITYQWQNAKDWLAKTSDSSAIDIALAVNRIDKANFVKMDSVVIPTDLTGHIAYYFPFPFEVKALEEVNKIIFFSYPTQTFATYENGQLVHTGPTNMGRKKDQTPTGLFFTNWKAEETTSTFNDEWDLKWNFNIANKLGVGWHQYELPGYPASHSCLRLLEKDAKYLYDWADQWVLLDDETVSVKGTPVVIFGAYDFEAKKPWLQLVNNPKALNIAEDEITKQVKPFLKNILAQQQKRVQYQGKK
ncbi:L,D-transpeptidase [Flavobacterium sp. J49]|uniref:L,D-transpeptidase n=1 Tax=Flavobacterium sp. J49 TaxID=2718534 RepID=UPI001594C396|nr:L,D-transpeptidase [Flavobacterium sp. J49]MBF6642080.1 L,D-transpeptidase [Flavobacterium sp. J49]NIC03327.1 L,D-transpeptidase [Flavobacterium sp. J49]